MKNSKRFFLIAVSGVLTAALITLSGFSALKAAAQAKQLDNLSEKLGKYIEETSPKTKENDVTIGMQYKINATDNISNAYKSGNESALDSREKEILSMAEKVLDEIIKDGMSDYEKEKAVYSWMCKNISTDGEATLAIPTSTRDTSTPYGVLKDKTAVCVGYATTFRLFMQMMNLECMVIHDPDLTHSWNLVKLEDDWYQTDIYMDTDTGNFQNFNMCDSIAKSSHSWDDTFFPAANGTKYCYAYMSSGPLDDIYKLPALVKKSLDKGEVNFGYSVSSALSKEETAAVALMADNISRALCNTVYNDESGATFSYSFLSAGDKNIVWFNVIDCGEDPESAVDKKTTKKIESAVTKVFGEGSLDNGDSGIYYSNSSVSEKVRA